MFSAAFLLISTMSATANAQERSVAEVFSGVKPNDFVVAFLGHCVQNPGRLDKIGAGAEALGYADAPEPFWTMFAPQNSEAPYHSWFVVKGQGSPYLLGISEAPLYRRTYQICSISNPYLDAESVLRELRRFVELGDPIADDSVAGQRTRVWNTPSVLADAFLTSSDIGGMGYEGVTVSLAAPKQY
jgi:hypothetical protein